MIGESLYLISILGVIGYVGVTVGKKLRGRKYTSSPLLSQSAKASSSPLTFGAVVGAIGKVVAAREGQSQPGVVSLARKLGVFMLLAVYGFSVLLGATAKAAAGELKAKKNNSVAVKQSRAPPKFSGEGLKNTYLIIRKVISVTDNDKALKAALSDQAVNGHPGHQSHFHTGGIRRRPDRIVPDKPWVAAVVDFYKACSREWFRQLGSNRNRLGFWKR